MTYHTYDRAAVLAIAKTDRILRAVVGAAIRHPDRWVKHRRARYALKRLPNGKFLLVAGVTTARARHLPAAAPLVQRPRKERPKSSPARRRAARTGGRASRKTHRNDPPPGRKALKVFRLPRGVGEIHVHASRPGPRRRWIVERWGAPIAGHPKGNRLSTKTYPTSREAFHAVKVMIANVKRHAKAQGNSSMGRPYWRVDFTYTDGASQTEMSGSGRQYGPKRYAVNTVKTVLIRTGAKNVKITKVEKIAP